MRVDATCQRSIATRHRHSMKPPLTSIKVPAVASLSRCGTFWNTVDLEQIQNNPFEISDYHDYYMFLMRPRTTTYYLLHPGALCQVMPRASDMVPMLAGRRGARCSTNDSWLREKVFTLRAALHQIHLSHSAAACTRAPAYRTLYLYRHVPYPRIAAEHAALSRRSRRGGTTSDSLQLGKID